MFSPTKLFPGPLLIICLLGLPCVSAGTAVFSQSAQDPNSQESTPRVPGRGLRVLSVVEGSPAERAGLQYMDMISKYGEFELLDQASYFVARDHYEKSGTTSVTIVFWRGTTQMTAVVPPGRLGMDTNEYNEVSYEFDSIMDKANINADVRERGQEYLFKDSYVSPEKLIEQARALLDRAEKEGTLTPAQLLVARIYTTFDDAPPEELKKQAALLAQLFSTQPQSYVVTLGQTLFMKKKRYRAAIECFKLYLEKVDPSDVSVRLNLGVACNHLRRFDEADAAAEYVFKNKLGLSEHGYVVAYEVKALAALGHRDYPKCISFAEKAFERARSVFNISLIQLAAAQSGDLQRLAEASRRFKELMPAEFEQTKVQVDAVEALALAKNKRREEARTLIMKWKDTEGIERQLTQYWKGYPDGSDVLRNWKELMQN